VFFFVLYAVAIWYMAARWRRQWGSFLAIALGLLGLLLVAHAHYRLSVWSNGRIYLPVLQVLLYPYTVLVVGLGLYIAFLPRRAIPWEHCPGCEYDLRGLDAPVTLCPECGMTEELAKFVGGREFRGFPAGGQLSRAAPATPRPAPAPRPEAQQWPASAAARACLDPADG
jgi:hypothetical protein